MIIQKNNLINSMPEKAKELNDILNEYLIKIDAEDLNEVYQVDMTNSINLKLNLIIIMKKV